MKQIDVRKYAPQDRQAMIFETFGHLALGETMLLINDHDPSPLESSFIREHPKEYTWGYIEEGPDVWRVAITKTAGS